MPLYEYVCEDCNERFEEIKKIADRKYSTCTACGGRGEIAVPVGRAPGLSIFKSDWYEHLRSPLDGGPIYCRTAQDLRNACDKHGKTSVYLEDGVHKTSPGPDYDKDKDPERMPAPDVF